MLSYAETIVKNKLQKLSHSALFQVNPLQIISIAAFVFDEKQNISGT